MSVAHTVSEGFDIDEYPRAWSTIFPMSKLLNSSETYNTFKGYAERALEQFNTRERTNWVIDKVLKVNGGGCRDYHNYITCSVKTSKGEEDVFQVEAVENIDDNNVEFPTFRLKPEKDNGIKCLKSAPGPSSLELSARKTEKVSKDEISSNKKKEKD